jgi:hypothetical protein
MLESGRAPFKAAENSLQRTSGLCRSGLYSCEKTLLAKNSFNTLQKNLCFVSGHGFSRAAPNIRSRALALGTFFPRATAYLAAASIRPYVNGFVMNPALAAEVRLRAKPRSFYSLFSPHILAERMWPYRLQKNLCFVSGHGFSRAVKSHSHEGFSP